MGIWLTHSHVSSDENLSHKEGADADWATGSAAANKKPLWIFRKLAELASVAPGLFLLRRVFASLIIKGTLHVYVPYGRYCSFGSGEPQVTIRITRSALLWRLAINPDLAIGEAYMDGTLFVERNDIYDFLALCLSNLFRRSGHWSQGMRSVIRRLARGLMQYNPISRARANVAHHYDLSDRLYELFLDSERQYSCAYFAEPTDSLDRAQAQKMRHIAAKLLLKPGQKVLDIGCGWGGLGRYLAHQAKVDVTGLTLSSEQYRYALARTSEAQLSERVHFHLRDYRQEQGQYDRIVSVGMFEHVGLGHYGKYFRQIYRLLKEEGIALIHTIGRADGPGTTNTWLRKYIFPGGYCPALSEIMPTIEKARLFVTDIEVLRLHYAETLKAWRNRFNAQRTQVEALYDERFYRMWDFYLAGSEASFRHGGMVVFQIQLARKQDAVPLQRDYMFRYEQTRLFEPAGPLDSVA
jgi:cyclopropane-fatty-acyl-phospholipid synthase